MSKCFERLKMPELDQETMDLTEKFWQECYLPPAPGSAAAAKKSADRQQSWSGKWDTLFRLRMVADKAGNVSARVLREIFMAAEIADINQLKKAMNNAIKVKVATHEIVDEKGDHAGVYLEPRDVFRVGALAMLAIPPSLRQRLFSKTASAPLATRPCGQLPLLTARRRGVR